MRVEIRLTGTTPLSMHNRRLADQSDEFTREIGALTDKRSGMTDVERQQVEKLEFLGSLYYEPEIGVYVESAAVVRTLQEAAKVTRNGKSLLRALCPASDRIKLEYSGPKTPEALWEKPEFRWRSLVAVKRSKVIRMRPIFRQWGLTFHGEFLEDAGLNKGDFSELAGLAGRSVGLLEGRGLGYGRFSAEVRFGNGTV